MEQWDVVVVGAGPAGSVAAYHLARGGARVAIVEQKPFPRYKTCGGGVAQRARDWMPADIGGAIEVECRQVRMGLLDSGIVYHVRRDDPIVIMTMRSVLDQVLLDAAVSVGARLFSPCRARSLEQTHGRVELRTDGATFRARSIVAADGALSPTACMAGWVEPSNGIPALEWEVHPEPDQLQAFAGTACFDFDQGLDGYAWVFPKRDHLSVGLLSIYRGRPGLVARLGQYLERSGITRIRRLERHGWTIPIRPRRDGFVRNGVLLVGDAAGLTDPVTCEGISHAVISGKLAADVLLGERFDRERVARAYAAELRVTILRELRFARLLARALYQPRLRHALFRRAGQELCEAMTEVIQGRRTYRELLTRPSNFMELIRRWLAG